MEVLPFAEEHLAEAGRLLAERHRRHRLAEPLLSPRYEDPAEARAAVAAAWGEEGASGSVAASSGAAVGFLLGSPKSSSWGPNVWVESAGWAADDPETVRELYAHASARWVDEGRLAHYVLAPAHDDDLVRAWFRLAFGHQQTHGIQPVRRPRPAAVPVRRAARSDIPVLARLDLALPDHQGLAPTFSAGPVRSLAEVQAEWEEDFDDPDFAVLVAEHGGTVVGSLVACALERSSSHTGPARPDGAAFIGFAAVFPEQRGLGAGRALFESTMRWCHDEGFTCLVADWRETNLLATRSWRGLGFRDSFLRLHRLVGH